MDVQKNENTYLEDIIVEIDENNKKVSFKTSELINIIIKNFKQIGNNIQLDYNDFGKKYSIPEIICKHTKVTNILIHKEIYYKDVRLLFNPVLIHFIELDRKETTYLIYNESLIDKIKESLHFNNPIIIMNRNEYPYENLRNLLNLSYTEFTIEDKEIEDYQTLFSKYKKIDMNKGIQIKKGTDLTKNFKYYFKYPSPDDKFDFIFSTERSSIFSRKHKNKIIGYCGPMGIGKSTTLLGLLKIQSNYCYLNIKALKEVEEHVLVWRDQILIPEIANAMLINSNYEMFSYLKNELNKYTYFWDAIERTINYFIEKEIKINFIFDQYKEKLDPNYNYIKKFQEILQKDGKDIVSIIISSSINDKDVRDSLINQWVYENTNVIIRYIYLNNLIDIKEIIEKDQSLNDIQKNMIIKDFSSIPKFYYAIRNIKNKKDLNEYKDLQINKIRNSLNEFFSENNNILFSEKLIILLNLRSSFGNNLTKENFKQLLKILPFKYFIFDIKEYIVNFSFPLVKDIFDDFLSNEICKFLKSPIPSLKEGTIGDILELNLINDLSNECFCKFDQITKVDSIWDINEIKYVKVLKDRENILILQTNNEARLVDFAILNHQENLLLYQCKKALKSIPKNPITKQLINENSIYLKNKYKTFFDVDIKKIYLFYVTGITFFMKDKKLNHRTWGGNEREDFKIIKDLAEYAKSELFFYDVINRTLFYENNSEFSRIGDIIEYANKFSSPALIYSQKEISDDINERKKELTIENYNDFENILNRISFKDDISFFTSAKKAFLEKNYPQIAKNKIDYYIENPKYDFLKNKRMLGLKKGDETYILINKKKQVKREQNENRTKYQKRNVSKEKKSIKEKKAKKNVIEEGEFNEEKEEKNELEIKEEDRALMIVKDNDLSEVYKVKSNFYETLDYVIVFKDNISL